MEGRIRLDPSGQHSLEETVRITLAARAKEDHDLEASTQQEIACLRAQHEEKLAKCDQEIRVKEEDVKAQERLKTAALENKHKEELEALQKKQAEEMAQRIRDTEAYIKIAVEAARDDKSHLDCALRDTVIKKEREFEQKKTALEKRRKLEDENFQNTWFQRIQEQVSHSSESTPGVASRTFPMRPLSNPSPPYSDEHDDPIEADLPYNDEKCKNGHDNTSNMAAARGAGPSGELAESTAPKVPAQWDFAARYDKSKDVIPKPAAPKTVANSSKQQAQLLAKLKNASPKSNKKAKKGEESKSSSTQSGKNSIEWPPILPSSYAQKPAANKSSQVPKAPTNAPIAPRGQPIPVADGTSRRDHTGTLPWGQPKPVPSRSNKRARHQQDYEHDPIHEAMPPTFGPNKRRSRGDSWRRPLYDNSNDRTPYEPRDRYESKAEQDLRRSVSFNRFPVLKGLYNSDRNEARVEPELRPSKNHLQDNVPKPKSSMHKSNANGESPSSCFHNSSGAQPTCPALVSHDIERSFIDVCSDSDHQRADASIVETGSSVDSKSPTETQFPIRQIRYQREDNSIFEWTKSGTGKTELRLDKFTYKPYINDELCQDWHYSNWAIVPDHVELLGCDFDLALLHAKRTKTVQANSDLWVHFGNKEVLQEFIKSFVLLAKFPADKIIELDKSAIPEMFTRN